MKLSIVIPCYFESGIVKTAYDRVKKEVLSGTDDYELIFVDDGSTDSTYNEIAEVANQDPKVMAIKLTSNVGSHMAIRAGLSYATGDCACFIACDMQEPPELITKMKSMITTEKNIIWAVRNSRKDRLTTIISAKIFYWLARRIVTKNIPPSGASMFMVSRKVISALTKYDERNLTLEGLFATMGFKSDYLYYERQERIAGKSKWTFSKKLKLFIDFFVAYSNKPIRFVSFMGIIFSLIGFVWTLYIVARALFVGDLSPGWPALISVLLLGFGITNISLGIIAEYLWRTLDEVRKRPKYIIESSINLPTQNNNN
jgi:glycosyltransferase involved in cell wall biosynthesis